MDESTCNNPAYVNRIGLNIARQFKDPNARITCCSTDGCNWRWDTAVSNQAIGQSLTAASSDTVYYGYIGRLTLSSHLTLPRIPIPDLQAWPWAFCC